MTHVRPLDTCIIKSDHGSATWFTLLVLTDWKG